MSYWGFFYDVKDGNLRVRVNIVGKGEKVVVLGSTVKQVREELREAVINADDIGCLDGMCSSSVDFGEEDGLPDASKILGKACAALEQEYARGIHDEMVERAVGVGKVAAIMGSSESVEEYLDTALRVTANAAINLMRNYAYEGK